METLTVTLKTVTPLFLGGARQNEHAELRPPSIKGALRFWYRAIDPQYNQKVDPSKRDSPTWEQRLFGRSSRPDDG